MQLRTYQNVYFYQTVFKTSSSALNLRFEMRNTYAYFPTNPTSIYESRGFVVNYKAVVPAVNNTKPFPELLARWACVRVQGCIRCCGSCCVF